MTSSRRFSSKKKIFLPALKKFGRLRKIPKCLKKEAKERFSGAKLQMASKWKILGSKQYFFILKPVLETYTLLWLPKKFLGLRVPLSSHTGSRVVDHKKRTKKREKTGSFCLPYSKKKWKVKTVIYKQKNKSTVRRNDSSKNICNWFKNITSLVLKHYNFKSGPVNRGSIHCIHSKINKLQEYGQAVL